MSAIRDLARLGLYSEESTELFRQGTRDNKDIKVLKDRSSGVIFLSDNIVPEEEYASGCYWSGYWEAKGESDSNTDTFFTDYDIQRDLSRRLSDFHRYYAGKKVIDFGCGHGLFLRNVLNAAKSCAGVELTD